MNKLPEQYAIARSEAQNQNESRYQGRPCRRGHSGERWTQSGQCIQCGYENSRAHYRTTTGRRTRAAYRGNNRPKILLLSAKHRAVKTGREFSLTEADIIIPDICPVLGIPMTRPSIDRFDNDQGYTVGNIRVISERANKLKNDGTIEEFESIIRYMKGESA